MQITDISFKKPETKRYPKTLAYADITFDNQMVIKGVKIISSSQGLFVSMPVKKTKKGFFREIIGFKDDNFYKQFEAKILATYEQQKDNLT